MPRRHRHADLRAGRMQRLLRRAHVRPLLHQFRRQADRQVRRQLQVGELEASRDILAREPARQSGQRVALLRQLFLQRRQCQPAPAPTRLPAPRRRPSRPDPGCIACARSPADRTSTLIVSSVAAIWPRNDASCSAPVDDVRGQRHIRRLQLEPQIFRLGFQRFDRAAVGAEHVRHERHVQLRRDQAVVRVRRRPGRRHRGGRGQVAAGGQARRKPADNTNPFAPATFSRA